MIMFKFLISPGSKLPKRFKAIFRYLIWRRYLEQMTYQPYEDYEEHGMLAAYEWRGHCIAFLEAGKGLVFRW